MVIYSIKLAAMNGKVEHGNRFSSFFSPENIEIFNDPIDLDILIYKLLENLAINYGIGNINTLYNTSYKSGKLKKVSLPINDVALFFHFRTSIDDSPRIAIAITKEGIINSNHGSTETIRIVIIVTTPKDKPDIFLKIAIVLKNILNSHESINAIIKPDNANDAWECINKMNIVLHDFIHAGDLMEDVTVKIIESNNLKDAIDTVVCTGHLYIPVVDLEGNLIGEVSSMELMKICLPRYLLWMNDLTPIINFEPFQNMLKHESNTWLAEIMNYSCIAIQKEAPFMEAGILMTKKSTTHTYVTDNQKLIGIITLQFFLNQILRV